MRVKSIINFFIVTILLNFLIVNIAYSEHEADHRYTIKGQLLDAQKKPVAKANLKFMIGKKVIKQAVTNSDGKYKAKLHLHDPDYGKELEIIVPGGSGKVIVEFALGDKKTERFHFANFVDGKLVVEKSAAAASPAGEKNSVWVFVAIAVIVVLAIVIVLGDSKKKKGKKKKGK